MFHQQNKNISRSDLKLPDPDVPLLSSTRGSYWFFALFLHRRLSKTNTVAMTAIAKPRYVKSGTDGEGQGGHGLPSIHGAQTGTS